LCTAASDLAGFAAVRFVVLRAVVVRFVVVRFAAGLAAVREEDDFFGCGMAPP
jgi:hypothetical protein